MKKLLFYCAFLSLSSMNYSAGVLDFLNAANSCAHVLSASSDDIIADSIKLPFSTNSVAITFVAGCNGIAAAAMFDKNVYLIGIPMRVVAAAFLVSGALYLVYKASSGKEKEKSEEE